MKKVAISTHTSHAVRGIAQSRKYQKHFDHLTLMKFVSFRNPILQIVTVTITNPNFKQIIKSI